LWGSSIESRKTGTEDESKVSGRDTIAADQERLARNAMMRTNAL
jgi:hypothetical protein